MKINGIAMGDSNFAREECIIPRYGESDPLILLVSALPLNWTQLQLEHLPAPNPPRKKLKEEGSNKLILDGNKRPIYYTDDKDADYKRREYEHAERMNAWMFYEALRNDIKVQFSSRKPGDSPSSEMIHDWLDALRAELNESGITVGDISIVIDCAQKLSNAIPGQVQKAREDFLSRQREEEPGNSQNQSPDEA